MNEREDWRGRQRAALSLDFGGGFGIGSIDGNPLDMDAFTDFDFGGGFGDLDPTGWPGGTPFDFGDGAFGGNGGDFDLGDIGGVPGMWGGGGAMSLGGGPLTGLGSDPQVWAMQQQFQAQLDQTLSNPAFNGVMLDTDTGRIVNQNGIPIVGPALEAIKAAWAPIAQTIDGMAGTASGRLLLSLGLGAAGIGLANALSGTGPKLKIPDPQVNPAQQAARDAFNRALTQSGGRPPTSLGAPSIVPTLGPQATAGQDLEDIFRYALAGNRNVADALLGQSATALESQIEQGPMQRGIRNAALNSIPDLMFNMPDDPLRNAAEARAYGTIMGGPEAFAVNDPVQRMMQGQLLRVMSGQMSNPALEQQFQQEQADLANYLHRSGIDPSSTPGIAAINGLRDSQEIRKHQDMLSTVNAFGPQEQARMQFGYQFPQQTFDRRYATVVPEARNWDIFGENVRANRLRERTGVSQFGVTPPANTSATLTTLVPPTAVLGLGDAEAERRMQMQFANNALLQQFALQGQGQRDLASGIGGVVANAGRSALSPNQGFSLGV